MGSPVRTLQIDRPLILATKTCRKDLGLVVRLCRSLQMVDNSLPHLIVVDDPDVDEARRLLAEFSVDIRPSSSVVPRAAAWTSGHLWPAAGRTSRLTVHRRRVIAHSVGHLDGWWIQQIAKLGVAQLLPDAVVVHVDSDSVFTKRPNRDWFIADDGRAMLFAAVPKSLQQLEWRVRVHRELDVKRYWERPDTVFIQMPQVVDSRVALRLIDHLESRRRLPWWRTLVRQRLPEFELYGSYAAYVDSVDGTSAVSVSRCPWSYEVSSWDEASLGRLRHGVSAGDDIRFVAIQSTADPVVQREAVSLVSELLGGEL